MQERIRSIDRVREAARSAGLAIEIREMPQSTRTAEEAAAACGTTVAQIVKSLIFRKKASGDPVLILVSGANRVNEAIVAAEVGDSLERMDPRAVRDATGFAIGGVAPIGSIAPLATFMDGDLLAYGTIWAAAGKPNAVFSAAPDALRQAAAATIIRVR